jgi:hypothetical protein
MPNLLPTDLAVLYKKYTVVLDISSMTPVLALSIKNLIVEVDKFFTKSTDESTMLRAISDVVIDEILGKSILFKK